MTEFIILSRGDIMTLCKDEPVKVWVDKRPMLLCSDEYFERQKSEDKHIEKENNDTEIWHGIHGQVVAPKGTFEKIWNDAKEDDYDV